MQQTDRPMPPLTLWLAAPRGFCAGVDRAIKIVEMALAKYGAPVYVRHEIVHNKYVVDDLRAKGAVFVEELADCPDDRPVIFSAHGVPKSVPAEAAARQMLYVDATCPLVSKVHIEAERHHENGLQIVMIGHAGHPETVARWVNCRRARCCLSRRPAMWPRLRYATRRASPSSRRPRCRSMTRRKSSPPFRPASRPSSARTRKTSATPPPTVRRRSRQWRNGPRRCWWWARPTRPIPGVWSRWGRGRAALMHSLSSGLRISTGARFRASPPSASPPGRPPPKCWSRRSSTPSAPATT